MKEKVFDKKLNVLVPYYLYEELFFESTQMEMTFSEYIRYLLRSRSIKRKVAKAYKLMQERNFGDI